MTATVRALSGVGGKSPACFLVEMGGSRLLLDLGEGPSPGQFPDLSTVGPIDAILISHGHADHIGGLHLAGAVGNPPIHATSMTRDFAGHPALATATALPLQGQVEIAGLTVETGRAGHAAGGIWMRIGGSDGVLYTGDMCRESLLYPVDPPLPADTLIADASYGPYDADLAPVATGLLDRAARGPLLLPLPPTGRGIEIAVLIAEAGLPLFICDQHRHVAELVLQAEGSVLTTGAAERLAAMLRHAGRLTADLPPAGVMIAANGGATGGLSRTLFKRFLSDPAVQMLFTGYVDEGTGAKAAISAGQADLIRWNVHPRLRDLLWIREKVQPRQTIHAFCPAEQAVALSRLEVR